jgi:hypothetical protein
MKKAGSWDRVSYFRMIQKSFAEKRGTWLRIQAKLVLNHPLPSGKDYEWCIITIVTKWTVKGDLFVLCLDLPSGMREKLVEKQLIELPTAVSLDPYWPQLLLVEQFLGKQDDAVWSIRDRVRDIEDVSKAGLLLT